jgi:hypothetical protein
MHVICIINSINGGGVFQKILVGNWRGHFPAYSVWEIPESLLLWHFLFMDFCDIIRTPFTPMHPILIDPHMSFLIMFGNLTTIQNVSSSTHNIIRPHDLWRQNILVFETWCIFIFLFYWYIKIVRTNDIMKIRR